METTWFDAPPHWAGEPTLEQKAARLCKMSVQTYRAGMRGGGMKFRYSQTGEWSLDDAQTARHVGLLSEEDYRHFCYDFRDKVFRFSDEGKDAAAQYAHDNGLPLPLSERGE